MEKNGISPYEYYPFDPVFEEYGEPRPADLVCCIDVLENIDPEKLESVLLELSKITLNFGFFSIHMGWGLQERHCLMGVIHI